MTEIQLLDIFKKGGPIMWPLLLTSIAALAVIIERICFLLISRFQRDSALVERVIDLANRGDLNGALENANRSSDYVARVLAQGLQQRRNSASRAMLQAAESELENFSRGIAVLDTAVTLAPLLGLLGTVTGMIRAFGLLGTQELDNPAVLTGGIAEALIATAFGLSIAIMSFIPFSFLGTRLERARRTVETAGTQLELALSEKHEPTARHMGGGEG